MSDESDPQGYVKLYHPSGALVTLPVVGRWKESAKGFDYMAAFSAVSDMIGVGFTVNAPGLEAGEQRNEVGFVVRCEKENQDRSITPILHFYSVNPAEGYKFLSIYLNTDAQVSAFERASGLKLTDLKTFPGAAPERGKSKQSDAYIRAVKPFPVVIGPNPVYDPELAKKATTESPYKVLKRVLIRYPNLPESAPSETKAEQPAAKVNTESTAVDQKEVDRWVKFLAEDPSAEELQHKFRIERCTHPCKLTRRKIWQAIDAYIQREGIEFRASDNSFIPPREVEQPAAGAPIPF